MSTTSMSERTIDRLGRMVLPADIRKVWGLRAGDLLDLRLEDDRLVMTKRTPECAICGTTEQLRSVRDRHICTPCRDEAS